MKKILLIVCIWIPASLALVAFPSAIENNVAVQQEICNWQLVDVNEAVGISDKERMSSSIIRGNEIYTSFSSPASEFCSANGVHNHTQLDRAFFCSDSGRCDHIFSRGFLESKWFRRVQFAHRRR